MAEVKVTLVVACALVDADKRVLIAQRPEGKTLAGLWEFPGGKIEAGEPANRDKLSISFNGIRVAKSGARDPSYDETEVSNAMKNPKIQIKVALGLGKGRDRVLTCDLTKEYVAINGDYRS